MSTFEGKWSVEKILNAVTDFKKLFYHVNYINKLINQNQEQIKTNGFSLYNFDIKCIEEFDKFIEKQMLLERNKLSMQKYENMYFKHPLTYYLTGCDDVNLAKERLRQFDAVIRLKNYENDIKVMEKIAGWKILDSNQTNGIDFIVSTQLF